MYKLEDHVRDCDRRYDGVIKTIDKIDQRLERIETMILDLKRIVSQTQDQFPYGD